MMMLRALLLLIGLLLCSQGFAETGQPEKMNACNADAAAKGLKGAERKTFMSNCIKSTPEVTEVVPALTPEEEKMKTCNADAETKDLKGEERKAFMSDCLKDK